MERREGGALYDWEGRRLVYDMICGLERATWYVGVSDVGLSV